ncbi:DUF6615 family protein [uncultured Hymenobacter sp.]|uniref:DUF6615 family protein n=1 Tax=uncultured Hymenobacter sp. TaxID=170016 RepID=UPI0035C9DC33
MPNALCAAFSSVSIATWNRVEEGRNLYWLGEETLTDLLIRDLLRLQVLGFNIQAFHKKEERENGADWEWWFQGSSGKWIGMRVQAKVIHQHEDKFKELHRYHGKEAGPRVYQCDDLILSAQTGPYPCVPIYCLYSHWLDPTYNKLLPIWVSHFDSHNFGCSTVTAVAVQRFRKPTAMKKANRCSLKDTLNYSIPLAGLVCSPFITNGSIAERAQDILEVGTKYILDSPPPYVTDLIERQSKQSTRIIERNLGVEIDLPTGIVGVLAIQQAVQQ